jgi:hypothetical protein
MVSGAAVSDAWRTRSTALAPSQTIAHPAPSGVPVMSVISSGGVTSRAVLMG